MNSTGVPENFILSHQTQKAERTSLEKQLGSNGFSSYDYVEGGGGGVRTP